MSTPGGSWTRSGASLQLVSANADEEIAASYDELGLFHENAAEFGITLTSPPKVRRENVDVGDNRAISALVWGEEPPQLVLLHGGFQNAHTWDTVALALGRPLVALDLPGHGHSCDAEHLPMALPISRQVRVANARDVDDVARAIEVLAPQARAVVGMSLGGLVALAISAIAPQLVRRLVLVDITPGVTGAKAQSVISFANGPQSFASFDEILARTIEFNPGRSISSLRRGVLHNAVRREDGRWVWRHSRAQHPGPVQSPHVSGLWELVSELSVPLMLVRGTRPGSVVDDADEQELRERQPNARIEHVDSGHSIQGDAPIELARLLDDFVF